jgi:hypothetical protein
MEILGKIKVINPEQQISATFKKRELVVTTEDQYPQHILIEFSQDKCDLLNNFKVGQNVNVGINLRGRSWLNPQGEEKFFNSIQGWKIFEDAAGSQSPKQPLSAVQAYENKPQQVAQLIDEPDDLPF